MAVHRIDLSPLRRQNDEGVWIGTGKALIEYEGELIGDSFRPTVAAARWLLVKRRADPSDTIEAFRDGVLSSSANVGDAAGLIVFGPRRLRKCGPPRIKDPEEGHPDDSEKAGDEPDCLPAWRTKASE